MDALEFLDALDRVDLDHLAKQTLEKNKEVIADLIATQLSQGIRSDGTEILPSYAPLTIEIKKTKSGLAGVTDRVTLYDTGEHYKELYAEVKGDDLVTGSLVEYSDALEKKYDTSKASVHKLTEDSKEELVVGYLQADCYDLLHQQTGLE